MGRPCEICSIEASSAGLIALGQRLTKSGEGQTPQYGLTWNIVSRFSSSPF
jgi:hypothetical protein